MDNWIDELRRIRAEQQEADSPAESSPQAIDEDLLKKVRAFEFLRDIRKELLGGVGRIELFENAQGYDIILALMWDGSVANPKPPRSGSKEARYIFIGVVNHKIWVNGQLVTDNTPSALQSRLLEAIRNPGRRQNISKGGAVGRPKK